MNTKKILVILLWYMLLGTCSQSYGMASEQIGPDSLHPTVAQQDWPKGIVGIPRHESRVYSIWVNGNENFYFKCDSARRQESHHLRQGGDRIQRPASNRCGNSPVLCS